MLILHADRKQTNPSSIFDSISLPGGNDSYLGHYCAKVIALRLGMMSMSGGLPGRFSLV